MSEVFKLKTGPRPYEDHLLNLQTPKLSILQFNERMSSETISPRDDIAKILYDFASQYASDALYDAAYMVDLIDRLNDSAKRLHVLRALNSYQNQQSNPEKGRYVSSVAHDLEIINNYINTSENNWLSKSSEGAERVRTAIDYSSDKPIPEEAWDKDSIPPDLGELANLAESINIESVLVKSAQMLQLLKSDVTPGAERFRTILAIESTYAPLCEIIGFDALAATLLSEATCSRLAMSGNQRYIDKARAYMESMGDIKNIEEFVESMPTKLLGESSHEAIADSAKGYDVYFSHTHSHAEALAQHGNPYVDSVSRIKTLGSLARKIQFHEQQNYQDVMPSDLVGMTIIAEDTESIEILLKSVVEKLQSIDGVKFVNAPSRDKLIQIKGSQEFINNLGAAVASINTDLSVKPEVHNGGFEAVKLTVQWPTTDEYGRTLNLPVEIQITHRESREKTRIGPDSHTLFKLKKYGGDENKKFLDSPEATKCLKRIRRRKDKLLARCGYDMNRTSRYNSEALHGGIARSQIGKRLVELCNV